MPVETHQPADRPRPRGYSEATSGAGIVAVSGQLPGEDALARGASFAEQVASSLARLVEALASAGAGPADILSLRIFVTDLGAYRAAAKDLGASFREALGGHYPAMTLLEVSGLADGRAMVEIEALAVREGRSS